MSAASARDNSARQDLGPLEGEEGYTFSLVAAYQQGEWTLRLFHDDFEELRTAEQAVRNLRSEGPALAFLCVDDDYWVILRPAPGGLKLLISDVTMAYDDDYAAEIIDELGVELPDLSPEELDECEPWADGDFDILADLGVSEEVLGVICDDVEAWPSEQLARVAQELGCGEEFSELTGVEVPMDEGW
ncbi:tRNA adenosine deaminase-associated protein [Corynebacterium uropygiale]|uniref:tRNA adenosine deaminase-associated protein n=1 Tax=Corynebacterium uropygiale TaxID=1775911 RepID=A0A9X1QN40_9CORY|nr:tRNA adenosine deaminase-associated protein [Corynebacterium uropygiale]MCF4005671.1 tRNA adenosine deaminase-associated protein [Corynebacterium uropygiale]